MDIKNRSPKRQGTSFGREMKTNWMMYLMALPAVLFFAVFNYLPIGGIVIAFKDFNYRGGIFGSPWCGFENFQFFIKSPDFFLTIKNTLVLNTLFIAFGVIFQVGMALLINEVSHKFFKKITQSVMMFPHFVSYIVVGIIVYNLFGSNSGAVNTWLASVGMETIPWFSNATLWPGLMTAITIWKGTGFGMVVYLAAITSIDAEMYEAAYIDGADRFRQIISITLPCIKPTIIILFILSIGKIFSTDAGMIWAIIGDNPMLFDTMDTIDTYVFRNIRQNPELGMTAAVGLMQSIMGFFLVMGANRISKKVYPDGALF